LTADYLNWYLQRQQGSLTVLVRITETGKVAGIINCHPQAVDSRDSLVEGAIVKLICIQKPLRGKRLTPVLINELKRLLLIRKVKHAFFFSRELVSKPVTQFTLYSRPLMKEGQLKVIDEDLVQCVGNCRKMKQKDVP
jgi:glycylpeptide N-tetradecanoyltransferase